MRKLLASVVFLGLATSVWADLQNVDIGGELRIRGRYFRNNTTTGIGRELRFPTATVIERALGPFGLTSVYDADKRGTDFTFVEQRTVLNMTADFTDNVLAFMELEAFGRWGEVNANGNEFRSNYLTGVDGRAWTGDDLEFYQAYVEAKDMWGTPLKLRIGRQELVFGESWLVGSRVSACNGISYDGIRATYAVGDFTFDGWWSKLVETNSDFADDDIDFYGLWGAYKGIDGITLEAYYLLLHDGTDVSLTNNGLLWEWVEDVLDLDSYDSSYISTAGVHLDGKKGAWDFDLQLAYQWGDADTAGALYRQSPFVNYGDGSADYSAYAGEFEVGYTFAEAAWSPRVFVGGAYFSGDDNRDIDFWDWLNPFDKPEASLAFNRLFSGVWYSGNFDVLGGAAAFTNFHQIRTGIQVKPTDQISSGLTLAYFGANETFDWPASFRINGVRIPYLPNASFWTEEADDELGYMASLWVQYQYSKDWWVRVGWERFFTGDGIYDGNFVLKNGHELLAGSDDEDMDYIYFDTQVKF